jgi:hypothetical protein
MSTITIALFQLKDKPEETKRGLLALIIVFGCCNRLATILNSVAIEREWATTIADGSNSKLTVLNTYLRRVDLLCKLVAPLFASLLTSVMSYTYAFTILAAVDIVGLVFELFCELPCFREIVLMSYQGLESSTSASRCYQSSARASSQKWSWRQ